MTGLAGAAPPDGSVLNVGDDAPVTTWELHRLNNESPPAPTVAVHLR